MLHAHGGVQEVQGSVRQDHPQVAEKRALLVNDSRKIAQRCGKYFLELNRMGSGQRIMGSNSYRQTIPK
jgi:hypothetical protein